MAAAVFEALEAAPELQDLSIRVLPGVTAMLAAAARAGAPLGHDFCAINLSDNLKPWEVIEKRLRLAAEADFAIAIYNPRSASRPEGFARALEVLREAGCGDRTIIFAHAVTTPREKIETLSLAGGAAGDGRHGDAGHRRQFGDAPRRPLGLCAEARVMTKATPAPPRRFPPAAVRAERGVRS